MATQGTEKVLGGTPYKRYPDPTSPGTPNAYGLYHDRFERHDGTWWLARRRYGSFSRTIAPGPEHEQVVFPLPLHDLGTL